MKFLSGVSSKSTGCTGLSSTSESLPPLLTVVIFARLRNTNVSKTLALALSQVYVIQLCEPVKFHLNKLIAVQDRVSKAGCFEDSNTTDVN